MLKRGPARAVSTAAALAISALLLAACGSSVSGSGSAGSGSGGSSAGGSSAGGSPSSTAGASPSAGTHEALPAATAVKPAASTSGVTLVVGDQAGSGAQALLTASGLIKRFPFTVKFDDFTSGPPMLEAMSAGHLDVGGVGDAPPVFSAAGGSHLAIVGALANGNNDAGLLVSPKSHITSIADLRGKKIAVAEGSSGDYHLLTVLTRAGLTPKDVTLVNLQPAEALAALRSGAIDAWDIGSPFVEEAESEGDKVLVNGDGYGAPYSYEVASTRALQSPQKVAAIDTYLKLLNQAHVWANDHPDAWAKVWAQSTGISLAVMDRAARDDIEKPTPVNAAVVASEQGLVNAFFQAGEIPKSFSFAPYVTSAFNNAV